MQGDQFEPFHICIRRSWRLRSFHPSGLWGNLYAASQDAILKFTPSGSQSTLAGTIGSNGYRDGSGAAALFYQPAGLCCDSAGYIYAADEFNAVIRRISPAGVVTAVAGVAGTFAAQNGPGNIADFNAPCGVALSPSGDLFEIDNASFAIRKIQTVISSASGPKAR